MSKISLQVESDIQQTSLLVDRHFMDGLGENFREYSLSLPVPPHHDRASILGATKFKVKSLSRQDFSQKSYFVISSSLRNTFISDFVGEQLLAMDSHGENSKDSTWLDTVIRTLPPEIATIVGIGGGTILNAVAYMAQKSQAQFISVPTTVLAAADAA